MKKSILICLIGLFMLAGTQTTQAQTKEETIEWIKEKLEKYGGSGRSSGFNKFFKDVEVSPCSISFKEITIWNDGSPDWKEELSFNPSLIKEWKVYEIENYAKGISATAKVIEVYNLITLDRYFRSGFLLQNREPEIHERMIKALLHLATFCEEKKEAF